MGVPPEPPPPPEEPPPPPPVGAEGGDCPRCGTPYEPYQEYCLECGLRLPVTAGLIPVLATAWRRRVPWYPGDWVWPVLGALIIASLGAALAILANQDNGSSATKTRAETGTSVPAGTEPAPRRRRRWTPARRRCRPHRSRRPSSHRLLRLHRRTSSSSGRRARTAGRSSSPRSRRAEGEQQRRGREKGARRGVERRGRDQLVRVLEPALGVLRGLQRDLQLADARRGATSAALAGRYPQAYARQIIQ